MIIILKENLLFIWYLDLVAVLGHFSKLFSKMLNSTSGWRPGCASGRSLKEFIAWQIQIDIENISYRRM